MGFGQTTSEENVFVVKKRNIVSIRQFLGNPHICLMRTHSINISTLILWVFIESMPLFVFPFCSIGRLLCYMPCDPGGPILG